jgi:hypothetical protein
MTLFISNLTLGLSYTAKNHAAFLYITKLTGTPITSLFHLFVESLLTSYLLFKFCVYPRVSIFVLRCFMGDVLACRVDECISEGVPHGVGGAFSIVENITTLKPNATYPNLHQQFLDIINNNGLA